MSPFVETRPWPSTINTTPASAIAIGSHNRVAESNQRRNLPPCSGMLAQARYLADFARFLATKGAQERDDAQALRELERKPPALPPGLELEWLGVSGYRLTYERHTLIIDPYVSRVPLSALLTRRPAAPDPVLIDRYIGTPRNVVGVLVGHTHFDHAVDVVQVHHRHARICQRHI